MRTPKEVYESDAYRVAADYQDSRVPPAWFADVYQALGQALERSAALEATIAAVKRLPFLPPDTPNEQLVEHLQAVARGWNQANIDMREKIGRLEEELAALRSPNNESEVEESPSGWRYPWRNSESHLSWVGPFSSKEQAETARASRIAEQARKESP